MGTWHSKCTSLSRLDGKTVVITGCNTGIGKITAKDLFQRGARVIMACRNMDKAKEAKEDITKETRDLQNLGEIDVVELDLTSFASIRQCANQINNQENQVNILINNAGVMMCPMSRTKDGLEMQIGTNHFGHFLFTMLLLPKIIASVPARIINVSSLAHKNGKMDFSDLNWEKRSYSSIAAYGQSKLANVLFTRELTKRLKDANIEGVHTYSLHPGVVKTELGRHMDDTLFKGAQTLFRFFWGWAAKSPTQGAQTTIHCAVSDEAGRETGLYYAECKLAAISSDAKKDADAERLWNESWKMVNLDDSYNPFRPAH